MAEVGETKTEEIDYEKLSYDSYTYRRVQRIRQKGLQHGVSVPKLKYQLTKPSKPRLSMIIMGILASVVFVGVVILGVALFVALSKVNVAFNAWELLKNLFTPTKIVGTLGLSVLGGVGIVLFYVLILIMFALPIVAIVYMYKFVRTLFALSVASNEEFAKGHRVVKYITIFTILGTMFVATMVLVLSTDMTIKAKIILSIILVLLAILMFSYVVMLIVEKVKASKWFKSLDIDRQMDYINHDKALALSKARAAQSQGLNDIGMWR